MFRKLLGLITLVLFAGCIALLPRLVYGNTGTPPSLSIYEAAPASPNPVAVGDVTGPFVTVSFAVNVNDGNEQNESGPVSVTNQQYTISGGGGMIVSVGAPLGYTVSPSPIPSAGVSTATVTGNSETSFALTATLYFPQSAAGDDTVSCSGFLTLSDGTQVGSSPSGNVPVTAVAVDSITLIPDPSTQQTQTGSQITIENLNYQIGQTITQSDFTITTTPSGFENNSIVAFSPSNFPLKVSDNNVTATCGVSTKTLDVVGVECTGGWGSPNQYIPSYSENDPFSAEIQGPPGNFSVTGSCVNGYTPTSTQMEDGVVVDGNATILDDDSIGTEYAETQITPDQAGGNTVIAGESGGVTIKIPVFHPKGTVQPSASTILTWSETQGQNYTVPTYQAQAAPTINGTGFFIGTTLAITWFWTDEPYAKTTVSNYSANTVTNLGVPNSPAEPITSEVVGMNQEDGLPPIISSPTWGPPGDDNKATAPAASQVIETDPGHDMIQSYQEEGILYAPLINGVSDPNWVVPQGGFSEQTFTFTWN